MNDNLRRIFRRMRNDSRAKPDETFKKNARIRVLNTVSPQEPSNSYRTARFTGLIYLKFAALAIVFLIMVSGSLVYTANFSEPGSSLYPIRTATSRILNREESGGRQADASPAAGLTGEDATVPSSGETAVDTATLPTDRPRTDSVSPKPTEVPDIRPTVTAIVTPEVTADPVPGESGESEKKTLGIFDIVLPKGSLEIPVLPTVPPPIR